MGSKLLRFLLLCHDFFLGFESTMTTYHDLGIRPIINASGSVTRLGGARLPAAVVEAYQAAAQETVPIEQLQAAASEKIAAVTGTEAGLVTCGSAAALTLGTAAILSGLDVARMEQLPDCTGFPREFIVSREHRNGYDHAVRAAGARLIEVGFNEQVAGAGVRRTEVWEYLAACGPETAGIFYVLTPTSRPSLAEIVKAAHERGLPVLVDAAGELPPRENLQDIPGTGADLVAFSGGKAIRGPQASGILCGRKELVTSAALQMLDMDDHWDLWDPPAGWLEKDSIQGLPRHGLGRSMKVAKEELMALLKALELFTQGAYDEQLEQYRQWLQQVSAELEDCPVSCRLVDVGDGQTPCRLEIELDESRLRRSAMQIGLALREGEPSVYIGHGRLDENIIVVNPFCLVADQIESLSRRLVEEMGS